MALMNCDKARELLELSFGSNDLPAELIRHLQECQTCAAFQAELNELSTGLGSDDDFVLAPADLERAVNAVGSAIAPQETTVVTSLRWLRPMIRIAAVVLVVAVSFSAYQIGKYSGPSATSGDVSSSTYGDIVALWEGPLENEMDDDFVSILIEDYSDGNYYNAGEALLGDISEEELEYLLENLEVGELL
jgi:hypothetical protein